MPRNQIQQDLNRAECVASKRGAAERAGPAPKDGACGQTGPSVAFSLATFTT